MLVSASNIRNYFWNGPGTTYPLGAFDLDNGFSLDGDYDESAWRALPWRHLPSLLVGRSPPHPDFDPKPSFDSIYQWSKGWRISQFGSDIASVGLNDRMDATANAPAAHGDFKSPLHAGNGINRVAAMIHAIDQAASAGVRWPVHVLRHTDATHGEARLHTPRQAKEFVTPLAKAKNRAENASNICAAHLAKIEARMKDETGGLGETATDQQRIDKRFEALEEYEAYVEDLDTHFAAALKVVDALDDTLPEDDLPLAQEKLIGWLEGDATGKIEYIHGARTQQGMDIPPACRDMENAIKKIGVIKGLGVLHIERADDLDEAKRQYDIFKARIENVKPYRVPEFRTTGHTTRFPTGKAKFKARTHKITVYQPPLPDSVVAASWGLTSFNGSVKKVRMTDDEIDYVLTLTGDVAVTFVCAASNLCGRNRFEITLEPPEEAGEGS